MENLNRMKNRIVLLAHRFWGRGFKFERERAVRALNEADRSMYQMLGEVSALIVHDISGPLHVVKFCVDQLKENPGKIYDSKYIQHLSENVTRATELIDSLRARLKNPEGTKGCTLAEAHSHVMKFLRTQFEELEKIRFSMDPGLETLVLRISRVDLIHLLDNLYRNSVSNLLKHRVPNPEIYVGIEKTYDHQGKNYVDILIRDNGTGLSRDRFEQLTSFQFVRADGHFSHESLGLKLIRRLVESNQGELGVVENPSQRPGTAFRLKLPNLSEVMQ